MERPSEEHTHKNSVKMNTDPFADVDSGSSDDDYEPSGTSFFLLRDPDQEASESDDSIEEDELENEEEDLEEKYVWGPPVPRSVNTALGSNMTNTVHWTQTLLVVIVLAVSLWMMVPCHHALREAIEKRNLRALEEELEAGVSPDACLYNMMSLPATFTGLWLSLDNLPLTQTLLKYGADPNYPYSVAWGLLRIPCLARALYTGQTKVAETLIQAGASPNDTASGFFGFLFKLQPLMIALNNGQDDLVVRLLEAGADPKAYSAIGLWGFFASEDPLVVAAASNNYNLVERLLQVLFSLPPSSLLPPRNLPLPPSSPPTSYLQQQPALLHQPPPSLLFPPCIFTPLSFLLPS